MGREGFSCVVHLLHGGKIGQNGWEENGEDGGEEERPSHSFYWLTENRKWRSQKVKSESATKGSSIPKVKPEFELRVPTR